MSDFVFGTRGSALALRQTELVLAALQQSLPDRAFTMKTIRTAADRQPGRRLEQLPGIGFFVKELEVALLAHQIDAAVHSMKDLPSTITDGLVIAAVTEREDPRDVLVAGDGLTLDTLPAGARVGTSSPRRAAQLRARRPDLVIVPIRGNVETRIRKVDAGAMDAVCLAGAGLHRIGLTSRITEWLPIEVMVPAPGQGALGLQVRATDAEAKRIAAAVDHQPTGYAVNAERAVLRRLQGGCRTPVGAFAKVDGDRLQLRATVASLDGSHIISGLRAGGVEDAEALGTNLADELLAQGAAGLAAAARMVGES